MSLFCELFGFSKQAYHKKKTHNTAQCTHRQLVRQQVLAIRAIMPRLGGRKLHHMLGDKMDLAEMKLGRDNLFAFLRAEELLVKRRKKYTVTTNSRHWMRKYPNLTRDLKLTRPEQLWVSDITYIDTTEGSMYLHLVTDAYSKQIMGQELSSNMESASTLKALEMALKKRSYPKAKLTHHSDRGLQYCSKLYTHMLVENSITISMTENGDPYENAVAERVNGILKDEFGLGERIQSINQAIRQTNQSIQIYNTLRPHYSCRYLTPEKMHTQHHVQLRTFRSKKIFSEPMKGLKKFPSS